MMRTILAAIVLAVFAVPVLAQDPPPTASTRGGCGPSETYFDVKTDRKQHPVAPTDSGKALVYIFEDIERGPTMRVGLDGAWVGANKGKSYFSFRWILAIIKCAQIGNRAPSRKRPSALVRP